MNLVSPVLRKFSSIIYSKSVLQMPSEIIKRNIFLTIPFLSCPFFSQSVGFEYLWIIPATGRTSRWVLSSIYSVVWSSGITLFEHSVKYSKSDRGAPRTKRGFCTQHKKVCYIEEGLPASKLQMGENFVKLQLRIFSRLKRVTNELYHPWKQSDCATGGNFGNSCISWS